MKQSIFLGIIALSFFINFQASAQLDFSKIDINYYLPATEYDASIPSPREFLGYEVGEWHVNHDKLLAYMHLLAEKSDRITIHEYARSYENRPLVYLTISSQANQSRIDQIQLSHQQLADPSFTKEIDLNTLPAVLFQGYSIHGDESSGSNAAMLVAYHMAAGQSDEVLDILDNTIILFDPCYNPDGLQRYTAWVNAFQDQMHVTDPYDMSHNEPWPTGRTNHYWFDLNRDWLLLTHPESRGRIKTFQDWKPNVLTDHHEMGTNSTFFFQPGVPSRTNPRTPQINQDLTEEISEFHKTALDSIDSKYFTKERFDDFYYGKGSTYPDGQGCVGILFEQATSEGILQESSNGLLSFPFCVRNQVVTSLSTYRASVALRGDLLQYKRDFYRDRARQAQMDEVQAYIVHEKDPWKRYRFLDIIKQHGITAVGIGKDYSKEGIDFIADESFVVPVSQRQYTMVKSIFETQTSFKDSVFYDVSTWTFPYAFNSDYQRLSKDQYESLSLAPITGPEKIILSELSKPDCVIIPWDNYMAPSILYKISKQTDKWYRSKEEFVINGTKLSAGSIFLDTKKLDSKAFGQLMGACQKRNIQYIEANQSIDQFTKLGLLTMESDQKPIEVAIVTGGRVNSYEAGDAWFQMDHRWNIPATRIDVSVLGRARLERYSSIILSDGRYNFDDETIINLASWVKQGGHLIVMRGAIDALNKTDLVNLTEVPERNGAERLESSGQVIGGAMFLSQTDINDPLFYGYADNLLPTFKKGTQWYEAKSSNSLSVVGQYTDDPLLTGYCSKQNLYKASNSASILKEKKGDGYIIMLVDNPNFRGYWYGGAQLFANCIFHPK